MDIHLHEKEDENQSTIKLQERPFPLHIHHTFEQKQTIEQRRGNMFEISNGGGKGADRGSLFPICSFMLVAMDVGSLP